MHLPFCVSTYIERDRERTGDRSTDHGLEVTSPANFEHAGMNRTDGPGRAERMNECPPAVVIPACARVPESDQRLGVNVSHACLPSESTLTPLAEGRVDPSMNKMKTNPGVVLCVADRSELITDERNQRDLCVARKGRRYHIFSVSKFFFRDRKQQYTKSDAVSFLQHRREWVLSMVPLRVSSKQKPTMCSWPLMFWVRRHLRQGRGRAHERPPAGEAGLETTKPNPFGYLDFFKTRLAAN
jgi:hypothetical protein